MSTASGGRPRHTTANGGRPRHTAANGGRPRHTAEQRPGATGREQILDAAAELFTRHGYAGTSTRMIAVAVGVKQASLYYHFESKQDILACLLSAGTRPTLDYTLTLAKSNRPAHEQLYSLVCFDVGTLVDEKWNLGVLLHLPEVRSEDFSAFRAERESLRQNYRKQIAKGVRQGNFTLPTTSAMAAASVVLAFVESVIALRADGGLPTQDDLRHVHAASVLRMLSCDPELIDEARDAAGDLLSGYDDAAKSGSEI